ncbi:MAG: hypothetical protein PHI85_04685 [Victivallaceae bacterium]|nr:hypothetical protein [Victivallaceae bacterium]
MCCNNITVRFPAQAEFIANAKKHRRLGHSFLIVSDQEAARTDFAKFLAMTVCCTGSSADGRPCGKCPQCEKIAKGSYEEMIELFPTGKTRQIPVGESVNPEPDTLRWFDDRLFLSGVAGKKIGLIHDADRLNDKSQNALLKTLEEPPEDCAIALITANPSILLPTIRSRCQTITLLANRVEFDFPGIDRLVAVLSDLWCGSPRGLSLGGPCASRLIAAANALQDDARTETELRWKPRMDKAKELELSAAELKNIEKKFEAAAAGLYLKYRKSFLEAIYTFTAQLALVAAGTAADDLPNPELLAGLKTAPTAGEIDRAAAFSNLAADLADNLNYMVNEELAFRSFALDAALL